ncbi:hypothetical protein K1719_034687 [Acacia pycnantha]|nr:hypothetical protein K1719_034687 [Acacia pycnantha]
MENIILQTPPKAPIQSKTIEPESKTQRSVQQQIMDDEKDQIQKNPRNNEVCKPATPDRLRVPKAFKYPERYTSPTDMMISPVTVGLLARTRKCGALLPPGKSLAKKFEMNTGKTPVKTEQGDSSEPTKEMMTFGSTVLVKYSKAFKPLPHLPTPNESQQCLLDALWNASTARQKHTTLNSKQLETIPDPSGRDTIVSKTHGRSIAKLPPQIGTDFLLENRTPSDGRDRIDQDVTSWFNTEEEYIYNGLLKLVVNLDRPTQVLNGEECPIDYMEFLAYGMVAAFSISEDFKELPFGEALNEEIRKQQKFGTVFVKYDKFLQDARLYESLGNKYAKDYSSLSFDTVVKKSFYQVWIPKDCERLSLIQVGVLDPNPENYGADGMFDDEYMADID